MNISALLKEHFVELSGHHVFTASSLLARRPETHSGFMEDYVNEYS